MLPQWPSNTREVISGIIDQIGRDVEIFFVWSSYACPDCSLDPITNTSSDSFCPTCSGEYWVDVMSGVTRLAHVTWKFDYGNEFQTGGRNMIGDARVKIMHSDADEALVKQSKYLVVDDKIMNLEKTTLLGAPQVNRIIMDLKEKEE